MPFWPFTRRVKVEPLTPEQLQRRLVDAGHAGRAKLREFCEAYRAPIEANVPALIKAPPDLDPENQAQMNRFIQGLGTAAQCLANELGSPALWNALQGDDPNNPIVHWQQFLAAFPERMQRLEHDALREELLGLCEEIKRFRGPGARQHEAFFYGRLGDVCFHSGRIDEAWSAMQRALEICRSIRDQEGVAAYLGNLAEIARYRGETGEAISLLTELHVQWLQLGATDAALQTTHRIDRLQAGEPLCRIVCRDGDETHELDELRPVAHKRYDFEFVRNRPSLQKAMVLTRMGCEKSHQGESAAALELFQTASDIDPFDPDPHYQAGVVLLELGAFGAAKASFTEADRLAPAWFRSRTDAWIAGQIESGELPAEVWTVLRSLEDGGLPKPEVELLARKSLDRFADFAPLWLLLGDCLRDRKATPEAQEAYRQGIACAQESDVESRLLAALAGILPVEDPERQILVDRALNMPGSLIAQAVACMVKIT